MLRISKVSTARLLCLRAHSCIKNIHSVPPLLTNQPNPPLQLDPSLRVLLQDVDISLANYKMQSQPSRRELEVMDTSKNPVGGILEDSELDGELPARKSPAALFGSQGIGAVILPAELQESIDTLISGQLRRFYFCRRVFTMVT